MFPPKQNPSHPARLTWRRRFSDKYTSARFYKLDVDEVPEVAQEVGVRAMPTFILYKDGEKVNEVVGANPPAVQSAIEAASA